MIPPDLLQHLDEIEKDWNLEGNLGISEQLLQCTGYSDYSASPKRKHIDLAHLKMRALRSQQRHRN